MLVLLPCLLAAAQAQMWFTVSKNAKQTCGKSFTRLCFNNEKCLKNSDCQTGRCVKNKCIPVVTPPATTTTSTKKTSTTSKPTF